jgi:predicted NAD/FAD-dependent oxidoreductase
VTTDHAAAKSDPTSPSEPVDVLVIGAGIAGLLAAHRLVDAGRRVIIVDKGRGVGGRLATRRIGDGVFDHGAQFFTSSDARFAAEVASWRSAGVVEQWFDERLEPDGSTVADGHPRWRGTSGMTAIAKHLAGDLDVRTSTRVASIHVASIDVDTAEENCWRVVIEDGSELLARALLLTPPVPQTLELLAAGGVELEPGDRADLDGVAYHPCVAVLALLDGPSGLPEPGALRPAGEPLDWVADNQRKGISPVPAITVHAGPDTSRRLWDLPDDVVVAELLAAVPGLGARAVPGGTQVQRWRYARPETLRDEKSKELLGLPPAVLAGDAFAGARVPGAAASGWTAADMLLKLI